MNDLPSGLPTFPAGWRVFKVSPLQQLEFSTTYRAITPDGQGMYWGNRTLRWAEGRSAESILQMVSDGRMTELTHYRMVEGL